MNLRNLIAPHSRTDFVSEVWEKRVLHVQRQDPGHYDSLLPMSDIEGQLFGNLNLSVTPFKVYRGKEELGPASWSDKLTFNDFASNVADPRKLLAVFEQGYSLYLNFPERVFSRLRLLLLALERDLRVASLSHLIISPPRSQGFLPHTDPYGVFFLQLSGSKIWSLYGVPDRLPPTVGVNHHHLAQGTPSQTVQLSAGDLLYLPRGTAHAAATGDDHSVHLTLALKPPRGGDLLKLIGDAADGEPFFREYVPYGLGELGQDREAYTRLFKGRLIELIENADLFELLDRHHNAKHAGPISERPLMDLFDIGQVDGSTLVRVRTGLGYRVHHDSAADKCMLEFGSLTLEFPGYWRMILAALSAGQDFRVGELGRSLPIQDPDRVRAVKNLLRAGFLELVRDSR